MTHQLSEAALKHRAPSAWRLEANKSRAQSDPDSDELAKIKGYLKAGATLEDIIYIFNISSLTAKRIKFDKYVVNTEYRYASPCIEKTLEIIDLLSRFVDEDFIMIEYNLSETTLSKIKKGTYIPPKNKNKKKSYLDEEE